MRIRGLIAAFAALPFLLCGCWDNVDISRQNYAMSLWLGAGENGIDCIVQCCDPVASADGDGTANTIDVAGCGGNISAALAEATRNSSKTITYEHLQLIVIDKSLYKEYASECMAYFLRSADVQKTVDVVISGDNPAAMFEIKPAGEAFYEYVTGLLASDIPSESRLIGGSSLLVACRAEKDGHAFFLNKIRYDEDAETILTDGVGVFSNGGFVGEISADEWEYFRLFEKHDTEFNVNCDVAGYGSNMGFRCISSRCRLFAEQTDGGFALRAVTEASFTLSEQPQGDARTALDRGFYPAAEDALRREVKRRCEALAFIAQKRLRADFIGFGKAAEDSCPDWWEENHEKWDEVFASSPINFDITCSVISGGDAK